jgi:hypothetical protein
MVKRVAAGFLWFFAGWYFGAFVVFVMGVTPLVGPALGLLAAALVAGDPFGIFWAKRAPTATRERVRRRLDEALSGY